MRSTLAMKKRENVLGTDTCMCMYVHIPYYTVHFVSHDISAPILHVHAGGHVSAVTFSTGTGGTLAGRVYFA